jgi:NDP-sugar pyrophosphorylase family protein
MTIQAVILAGGLGTRLLPITETIPKPMISVAGAPYLEHQLRYLAQQGIGDVVLLTGHLGEQIESYFGDGRRLGMSIRYSKEPHPLGTGGAIENALPLLAESFLLLYGDSFLPIQYADVVNRLNESGALGVAVVFDNRVSDTSVKNNIALDPLDFVSRYDKTSGHKDLQYVEAGVSAFRRKAFDGAPHGVWSLEQDFFPELIRRHALAGLRTEHRFYDIGTPDRLAVIEEFFSHDHHANASSH